MFWGQLIGLIFKRRAVQEECLEHLIRSYVGQCFSDGVFRNHRVPEKIVKGSTRSGVINT
jgi:hypothetical protein